MTIEELCQSSADQLEKLTPEQLVAWFKPLLTITRPDLYKEERKKQGHKQAELISLTPEEAAKQVKVKNILAELGIPLDDLDI